MSRKKIQIIALLALLSVLTVGYFYYSQLKERINGEFSKPVPALTGTPSNYKRYMPQHLEAYPADLVNMVLATEDQAFYLHFGVDIVEITRVLKAYIFLDKPLRGASTITQQLIKNTFLTPEINAKRKLVEIIMAIILEQEFSKNFILSRYLNTVYLGQGSGYAIHGFALGAKYYFNKRLTQLNLVEMAQLVAMLKGPSYYHPLHAPERLNQRRNLVLSIFKKYQKTYYAQDSRP